MSPGEKRLGALVRELRERHAQLALSYITLAESGQQVNLSPSALSRLARALGVQSRMLSEAAK